MPTLLGIGMRVYNAAHRLVWPVFRPAPDSFELQEIEARAQRIRNDICDHLPTIFAEANALQPRLIVELGVRDGSSRFALERVARLNDSSLVSVDIEDCSTACGRGPRWHFVKQDDIEFASGFKEWCRSRDISCPIDVLFIDTSHFYEHTLNEIKAWFPLLSARCKVMFHDTNLRHFYRRLDGTIGLGWNSRRGVIQAIEDHLGAKFNERMDFVTTVNGWLIRHWSHCNGFTIMERTDNRDNH